MIKYNLIDLKKEYKSIKKEIEPIIKNIFEKGSFTLGQELENFEKDYARYCNKKYCVGTSSGTTALFFAIKSLNIGKGDEIIVPALTFTATAEAIVQAGATPVFVDIKEDTLLIDPKKIIKKISKKTKAIIGVHLYGLPVDINEIKKTCKDKKIYFIEDAAQAHGSSYNNLPIGSFGDIACFSFMAAKNLSGPGDGGCIVTNNKKIKDYILLLRNHGRKSKNEHIITGYSGRLDNLKAAILHKKLKHLRKWNKRREDISKIYREKIGGGLIRFQFIPSNRTSSYCNFIIRVAKKRDEIVSLLRKKGVMAAVHYPKPLHIQKVYSLLKYKKGDFPVAEKVCNELISLPMNPFLEDKEIIDICNKVNQVLLKVNIK